MEERIIFQDRFTPSLIHCALKTTFFFNIFDNFPKGSCMTVSAEQLQSWHPWTSKHTVQCGSEEPRPTLKPSNKNNAVPRTPEEAPFAAPAQTQGSTPRHCKVHLLTLPTEELQSRHQHEQQPSTSKTSWSGTLTVPKKHDSFPIDPKRHASKRGDETFLPHWPLILVMCYCWSGCGLAAECSCLCHTHTHTLIKTPASVCAHTAVDLAPGSAEVKIWYITQ